MIAAGFSGGEADQLRRAMAAWKRKGGVHKFQDRILTGMAERGYEPAFAEQIFQQILGFGDYGFPESHAYSFALLAYVSSWIKCHEPAIYLAAMLNSQPMGFYGPSQLVQDARRHGVEVRAIDVCSSDWDCTLERRGDSAQPAVRMGLRMVKGLAKEAAERLMQARSQAPFTGSEDLARRANLEQREMQQLARADALAALAGHRRQQTWEAAGQEALPAVLAGARVDEAPRSEEHTSELQSRENLVCRLLLEKKNPDERRRHGPDPPPRVGLPALRGLQRDGRLDVRARGQQHALYHVRRLVRPAELGPPGRPP